MKRFPFVTILVAVLLLCVARYEYAEGACDGAQDAGHLIYPHAACVRSLMLDPSDR